MANPITDPYTVLEISDPKSTSQKDIKAAYRRLCAKNHPDVNPGDHEAEERFKAVQNAYEHLDTEEKRQSFDQQGVAERLGVSSPITLQPNSTLQMVANIPLEKTIADFNIQLSYTRHRYCFACNGAGGTSEAKRCHECNGQGLKVAHFHNGLFYVSNSSPCQRCRQRGIIYADLCTACQGFGIVEEKLVLPVVVPRGAIGTFIAVDSAGGWESPSQPPAPLIIHIRTAEHERFSVNGYDVGVHVDVDPVQAMLGGDVQVPTLEGPEITLTMPRGTSPGFQHVFHGRGIPRGDNECGSLVAQVRFKPPQDLSEAQESALRQYLSAN